MITFLFCLIFLVLGYVVYGKFLEKKFGIDSTKKTPAYTLTDGVDYIPMKSWKVFLIQFLNIAGLGPIFGAVAGAMWGPVAFLWITLGCVFAGGVHDYLAGMISLRQDGLSLPEIIGNYLGKPVKQVMRVFTVLLMIIVGVVFIKGPAAILFGMTTTWSTELFWIIVVFLYYVLATLLPIDKLIGRIYPVFGFALIFMALGIVLMMFVNKYPMQELDLTALTNNLHFSAEKFPVFPMMFVTIACGAISGFHATQSPLMARCMKNEKNGRPVFFGAMITEGIVALIWAAIAMSFFGGVRELNETMTSLGGNAAKVVNDVANQLLGPIGAVLALLGVVAAPITSGDTAFRSARLIIADIFHFSQVKLKNRLFISVPMFGVGLLLTFVNFDIIWRYMAWMNQTLAMVTLWAITAYMLQAKKPIWMSLLPAIFMTTVSMVYILIAP
ncbi:MAG: carbon starvation protein A, partial [Paludibacteraceae bacterium]|nr:carbon starvation protein A [Paludibacteraceae bacterium]